MTVFSPPPGRPLPDLRRQAMRRQLETIIKDWPRRQRKRHALVVGAGAAVLIGTAGAAAYVQESPPVTDKGSARCYTVASLAGGDAFRGTTIAAAGKPGSPAQVTQAVSVCAALWRQGILVPGAAGPGSPRGGTSAHPVPKLVACVMPDGTAAVFPGDAQTCHTLGLPPASR
jgi:hypothetical protein